MNDLYYIISTNEDGASLTVMTKEQLSEALATHRWGKERMSVPLLDGNEKSVDLAAKSGFLIIKGRPVVPRPKVVIETWEVE